MHPLYEKESTQNIEGVERAASIAGGLLLLGRGIRGRGVSSVLQLALGGMALMRGVTGECQVKRKLEQYRDSQSDSDKGGQTGIERYSHMPMDSEVISPDFAGEDDKAPNSETMGHERQSQSAAATRNQGLG
jgi:hypothetical protein